MTASVVVVVPPTAFARAFAAVVGVEGGFSNNTSDPGNWTEGRVGFGKLLGTKFGIAASSHPTLDIENLTLDEAASLYKPEYWDLVRGDDLPPPVAFVCFDAAVNNGVSAAKHWLQLALGVAPDGVLGDITIAAAKKADIDTLVRECIAQRMNYMANLSTWHTFGLGWSRRLIGLPYLAEQFK
jgi:lysozyme family protein